MGLICPCVAHAGGMVNNAGNMGKYDVDGKDEKKKSQLE